MRTMASISETVPFRLDGYLSKLDQMKQWALEAIDACDNDEDKKHLTDIYNCYAFAAEQTLNFVDQPVEGDDTHGSETQGRKTKRR
ncbi:hypothetical protein [Endozoicomonas atrinae]|uniref:hypothetical protein n=2 Tax=Endozoicomonas atrinae TaxID=1333660 RepID=UPI0008261009